MSIYRIKCSMVFEVVDFISGMFKVIKS
jgi:hypothetical protein